MSTKTILYVFVIAIIAIIVAKRLPVVGAYL